MALHLTRRRFTAAEYHQMVEAGISEAWLIDLNNDTITIYRDPGHTGYRTRQVVRRGAHVSVAALPDRVLAVSDLLG